jgi:GntR family transcriptional regulator
VELPDLAGADGQSLNEQVADALRAAIAVQTLPAGARVPGENVLMDRYGVSRWTARAALDALVSEGIVAKVRNVGTFVRSRPHLQRVGMERYARSRWLGDDSSIIGGEASRQGSSTGRTVVELAEVEPPSAVAERLSTSEGHRVWVRRRIVSIEDRPHQIADSYYPLDVVSETALTQVESGRGGDFARLHDAGHTPTTIREEWAARMPSRTESDTLSLPAGTPVLEFTRTIRDQDGRPVEVMLSVIAADTTSLIYEFPVPD